MNVSCVIPAINEAANIRNAVCAAWAAGAFEVIVVDGGSTDETLDIVRRIDCQLVQSAAGRATQQNAGAHLASGDVLLFLHADTRLPADSIEQIREAMTDGAVRFGGFRQRVNGEGIKYRVLEWANAARIQYLGVVYGDQGIFVSRDLFFDVGKFPKVPLLEDLLLLKNLRKTGWPALLPGPLRTSARRWKEHGFFRQTLRNWLIVAFHLCGWSPKSLARFYARHDTQPVRIKETKACGM